MLLSDLTRRELLKSLGLGLGAATLGAVELGSQPALADFVSKKDKTTGKLLDGSQANPVRLQPDGSVIRPQLALPTIAETDVLVVGGGPAGCCAAIAAARPT